MAADSDGCDLTAVVTCEGDLLDPRFAQRFEALVGTLNAILGEVVKVRKLEPWNSVRVTLSIPREAALRLRRLAGEGSAQLRALGILSVQVEGDQVISLRLAGATAEPQEIRLQTTDGAGSSQEGRLLGAEPEKVHFKSPNVVCPADSVVPKVPAAPPTPPKPFPFTSMNQAMHYPPPPYPGKPPAVTLSSPLLVNLLQNDKPETAVSNSAVKSRTVNSVPRTIVSRTVQRNTKTQASPSPSALSSVRQNKQSTTLPPPPPYSVAVSRQWDSVVQTPFLDLTPSLTDLKSDDLEQLLPELARSPPEIPEELTQDKRNFLINPLTGELEPQSSGESDSEDLGDVFTGLPSPAALSDDDTNSTIHRDTTDQSDSETRSSHSDSGKHPRVKTKAQRDRGRDSPSLKPTEKIKLRLKLEKSEPINSAYKVDVSFIQQPKKASTSVVAPPSGEELRVPPLHISLRGRHHAFITNKKKKLNPDKPKIRKNPDKKSEASAITPEEDDKKKKFKVNHDAVYKEKQKERRGSDSDLTRKFMESNGVISVEKKRRLSQSEPAMEVDVPILGSTNVGTIAGLKPRKDKGKLKDVFKAKDQIRSKGFVKTLGEKFVKQVTLPTGEIDMEAKFKQRLMEGTEKGIPRPPHRTEEGEGQEKSEQIIKVESSEPPALQEKSPEPDKCNTPERKQPDLSDAKSGRSPNSGAQGEDSGIESMDALSEKSPNQASQSPHDADIPEPPPTTATTLTTQTAADESKSKTQVPDMLDIEAQLAKMEGLNGVEDVNENREDGDEKKTLGQCCELTSALQDSLKQGAVSLSAVTTAKSPVKEQAPAAEVTMVPVKSKTKEEDLEPLPVRVTPPLYTYSNPEKSRAGSESPTLSDDDSTSCSTTSLHANSKTKSLLEQLLIEIPDSQAPSSPSPATRSSVRTRGALSKLSSPELNSPTTTAPPPTAATKTRSVTPATKRKRNESDSSNNSVEELRNKKTRKCSENAAELIKACMGVDVGKVNNVKKGVATPPPNANKGQDESSDSDEPLIEKVRKTSGANNSVGKKVKTATGLKNAVSTRRSVRTAPQPNTRSKGDKEAEALRRKTRSAVSEGESKRKKEVK